MMEATEITEPAALIRIAKLYSPALSPTELYEATRGVWRVGPRKEGVRLAFAVAEGTIVEVYEVGAWHAAGSTAYSTRPLSEVQLPGRWEPRHSRLMKSAARLRVSMENYLNF